jgi:phosphate ABC transporter phosphate-binding protein
VSVPFLTLQPGRRPTMLFAKSRPRRLAVLAAGAVLTLSIAGPSVPARAATLVPVSGAGSTWSSNAMDQWIGDVNQYGIKIDFAATGSSDGRTQFKNGTVDFGVSEIPYGVTDNGTYEPPPSRSYAYMPIVAGGTSFMYQLHINGQQVTNLRLSGPVIAKIFTDSITKWNDPAIVADNPGIVLPPEPIVPVVRSDGSGTTAQLTTWMSKLYPDLWNAYCGKAGRVVPCGVTSTYPVLSNSTFVPQQLSTGVAGYITQSQSEGTIGYVETSYAIQQNYPVAKVLNTAGYYTEPTADNVAVALTAAQINTDASSPSYLTQVLDAVYANPDPRAYPLSSYSYMIIPTGLQPPLTSDKGYTLGKFAYYFLCEGQQSMGDLGYSPLPRNLVQAALDQVKRIPGVAVETLDISKCNNPNFDPNGKSLLAEIAPQPQSCDKLGVPMCPTHTGGATTDTYVAAGAVAPTTTPAAVGTKKPTSKPNPGKTTAPVTKQTGSASPGATPPAGSTTTTAPGTKPNPGGDATTTPVPGTTAGSDATPPPNAGGPAAGGVAVVQPTATDPFEDAPQATAAVAVNQAVGAVAVQPPVRAVSVSVAVGTGWSLQDTLTVLAVVLFVLVTVGPPLLSRRLRGKAS